MKLPLLGVAALALAGSLAAARLPPPSTLAESGAADEVIALGPGSTCPSGLVLKGTPTGTSYHTTMTWSCVPKTSGKPSTGTGSHGSNITGTIHPVTVQNTPQPPKKCKGNTMNALLNYQKC